MSITKRTKPTKEVLSRSQQLKNKKKVGKLVFILLIVVFFCAGSGYVLLNDSSAIRKILVEGNTLVESEGIVSSVSSGLLGYNFFIFPKASFLLYPRESLEKKLLSSFPRLKTAEIKLVDRNTLRVEITERSTDSVWCENSNIASSTDPVRCYFTDDSGLIFAESPTFTGNVFVEFQGLLSENPIGTRPLASEKYAIISRFARYLPEVFDKTAHNNFRLTKIILTDGEFDAVITDADHKDKQTWTVIFDGETDADMIAGNLFSIIESPAFRKDMIEHKNELSSIDLRYGKKVFYKFRN